jgi:hypothetical protein
MSQSAPASKTGQAEKDNPCLTQRIDFSRKRQPRRTRQARAYMRVIANTPHQARSPLARIYILVLFVLSVLMNKNQMVSKDNYCLAGPWPVLQSVHAP